VVGGKHFVKAGSIHNYLPFFYLGIWHKICNIQCIYQARTSMSISNAVDFYFTKIRYNENEIRLEGFAFNVHVNQCGVYFTHKN
jgi:hypothetical protein